MILNRRMTNERKKVKERKESRDNNKLRFFIFMSVGMNENVSRKNLTSSVRLVFIVGQILIFLLFINKNLMF